MNDTNTNRPSNEDASTTTRDEPKLDESTSWPPSTEPIEYTDSHCDLDLEAVKRIQNSRSYDYSAASESKSNSPSPDKMRDRPSSRRSGSPCEASNLNCPTRDSSSPPPPFSATNDSLDSTATPLNLQGSSPANDNASRRQSSNRDTRLIKSLDSSTSRHSFELNDELNISTKSVNASVDLSASCASHNSQDRQRLSSSSFQFQDSGSLANVSVENTSFLSSPRVDSEEKRVHSPDKSILDVYEQDVKSTSFVSANKSYSASFEGGRATDSGYESNNYSHVSAAHDILNSFIALNPSKEKDELMNLGDGHGVSRPAAGVAASSSSSLGGATNKALSSSADEVEGNVTRKSSSVASTTKTRQKAVGTNNGYSRKNSLRVITATNSRELECSGATPQNLSRSSSGSGSKTSSSGRRNSPTTGANSNGTPLTKSPISGGGGYDKKKLNEKLRQRLAERNQRVRSAGNAHAEVGGARHQPDETLQKPVTTPHHQLNTHLQKIHKRPASSSNGYYAKQQHQTSDTNNNKPAFDTFVKYGISPVTFPETVTFDSEDNESSQPLLSRRSFRKSSSETGITPASTAPVVPPSTRRPHPIPPPHGIGILQPDGVVFDDALLLRLARQARYGKLRSEYPVNTSIWNTPSSEKKVNSVKIHVYDLLQRDALVEMPYFNCNFPIGQCFKVMNNAANCLGTGAYHVGVEVNGIEYAFGANNIIGMSGVFTCPPKHSPGYEYRETLDFGNICTTRRTWIRIPKENALGRSISNALAPSRDALDPEETRYNASTVSTAEYTFRQIETFADGNTVIHSMAKEYMGTDYDLLRKNCCTFAHDVCLRLGVNEEDIPSWFHNAAKAGADAEDAITNAEQTVKNMFDCADMEGDQTDLMEGYNHGFEVIADLKRGSSKLKVVESPPVYRQSTGRQPLLDCEDHAEFWETLSWTY